MRMTLALNGGVEPEVALLDRLLDGMHGGGVPGLDGQRARLRGGDAGQFAEAHL